MTIVAPEKVQTVIDNQEVAPMDTKKAQIAVLNPEIMPVNPEELY